MLLGERGRSPGESKSQDQRQTIERIRRADDYGRYADRFSTTARTSGVRGMLRGR